jgi:hypothetical protein
LLVKQTSEGRRSTHADIGLSRAVTLATPNGFEGILVTVKAALD